MRSARAVAAALIVVLATSLTAAAQDWPARPVRFIVSFPAGGSTDVAARVVAEHLSRTFGQQVVVENKSGANGNLGVEAVAKSTPDGYTILVATDSDGRVRSAATHSRVVGAQVSSRLETMASLRYGVSMKISVSASLRERASNSRTRLTRCPASRGR